MNEEEQDYMALQDNLRMFGKIASKSRSEANYHVYRQWVGNPTQAAAECIQNADKNDKRWGDTQSKLWAMEARNPSLVKLRAPDLKFYHIDVFDNLYGTEMMRII